MNHNIVESPMPTIDVRRLRDKAKHTLSNWKQRAREIALLQTSNYALRDLVATPQEWDAHACMIGTQLADPKYIHGLVMSRLSDMHMHMFRILTDCELSLAQPNGETLNNLALASKAAKVITRDLVAYKLFLSHL
jgi:hypothetical protein